MSSHSQIEIAFIGAQPATTVAALEAKGYVLHHIYREKDPLQALAAVGARIRGVCSHGMAGISRKQLELMPNLEICAIHGVGLETSDRAACREHDVTLTIAPVLYDDVADIALALALAVCRRVPYDDHYVRSGAWASKGRPPLFGRKFTGLRAGIVGLGRIGVEVAKRLEGFKLTIAYSDPVPRDVPYRHYTDTVQLAEHSDILFLCAAGAAKAAGAPPIIGKPVIDALGAKGIFINIARGWLVDEAALVDALVNRRLGGAGLDVFDDEPNVPSALMALDNVVLSPHVASSTHETMKAMSDCVVENIVSWFDGKGAVTPAG